MSDSNNTTDFGFENVPVGEKAQRVASVFRNVAGNYDVMNDAMSMGLHRIWKRFAISQAHIGPGQKALDLAGGTGDLTLLLAKKMRYKGQIVLSDINESMLAEGKDRITDAGILEPVEYVQANAENLPFADNHFDLITIAFGLRNVTDKDKALRSMYRVLKPGGQLLVLEFSKPTGELLNKAYDLYSFNVLPALGKMIANDEDSYRYLAESIRMHPPQKELKSMMETAGFEDCDYHNLSAGIVALHKGYKF